jgi:phosphate uptake regulator
MKRKLVKQGVATMMISLPSKWIKEHQLEKGDEIELQEKEGKLEITTEAISKEKKEITIDITKENKQDMQNVLTHAYRKGATKIIIKGKNKDIRKNISSTTNNLLLGFEITEMSPEKIIIENISEPSEAKYDVMLRKTFQIIQETQELIISDFEKNSFKNLQEVNELRDQHDRFVLFCRRLLSKGVPRKDPLLEWELLTFLMHIQHRYQFLYNHASKNKIIKNNEIISLLKSSKEYFSLYEKAYWTKNINLIHKINELRKEFYFGKCLKALEKSKGNSTAILAYLREIFRIIQIGTSPILAELLEKS